MALYAYLDESGKFHDGRGFINLCALLSDDEGWETFNKRWNSLLRKHGFTHIHMTEFYSECRQRGWLQERGDAVLTEFIDTIRDSVLAGFAIGVDGPYFRKKYETVGKANRDPALFAVERILRGMFGAYWHWVKGRNVPARISLTFDEDEPYSIACYRVISRLRKIKPDVKQLVAAITFADDELYSPLQAVDILANLTTRYWRERLEKGASAKWPELLQRLTTAPESGYGIMWEPELWDADGIDRNWEDLRRVQIL
jgi:uncharacterized protein DUF3800